MSERRIGIRELKSKLSECVREVREGQTIVVTEHGRAVARLIPDTTSVRERLAALEGGGAIPWRGRPVCANGWRRSRTPAEFNGVADDWAGPGPLLACEGSARSQIWSATTASDCILR